MDKNQLDFFSDHSIEFGEGGETHQVTQSKQDCLTTQQGLPIADDQNSLTVGSGGPVVLEDMVLREKLFHFDHERIPERVVHARGYGAHGYFENYESLKDITKADLFQRKNEKTPVFVRFSTVVGNKGSADLARDVRGFAVKFYTKEGNWDLVGNNIPVFFIQDAMKFPDLIHAAKDEPDSGFPQAQTAHDNFWDFISLMPESMHMVMWIMSDRTIPRSFRFMEGFGVHTFRFVNAQGDSIFVKFHWKPKLGLQSVTWDEALKINGADPDFHRRDLWQAIQSGHYPEWELGIQMFDETFVEQFQFDILDATKLIPEEDVPIRKIGKLVLNKCVDNFFAETEQVAFCVQNIIPGLDFTNDPLLQGRLFSYLDTQISRLGSPNFIDIPINKPRCPLHFYQQDGHMTVQNPKGRVNYEPHSWNEKDNAYENPKKGFHSYIDELKGFKQRTRPRSFSDHYSQARQFYISQTVIEQSHIANALIFELSKVEEIKIRERIVSHLINIDKTLAYQVGHGLGLTQMPHAAKSASTLQDHLVASKHLSILLNGPKNFAGRKLGIVVSDGANNRLLKNLIAEFRSVHATYEIIGLKVTDIKLDNGELISGNQFLKGAPSVLYDAVALILSKTSFNVLQNNYDLKQFIYDAYHHAKFIGVDQDAMALLEHFSIEWDKGIFKLEDKSITNFIAKCAELRYWERLGVFHK